MKKKEKMIVVAAIILANFAVIGFFLFYKPTSPAPNFTLADVQGKTFSLGDYTGQVVVLSFMKTRCSSCKAEVTQLKQVYDKYHDDVAILSISIDPAYDTNEQLLQFMNETGITWRVARCTDKVKNDYDVRIAPTIFLIDKSGYIRFKHTGEITEESLSKEIVKLL